MLYDMTLKWDAANLPVKVVADILKVGEKRHWAEEARQLIPCHRGEAAVFKGTEHTSRKNIPQKWSFIRTKPITTCRAWMKCTQMAYF